MCLITKNPRLYTAKKDKVVYKVVIEFSETTINSICHDFTYTIDWLYSTTIEESEYNTIKYNGEYSIKNLNINHNTNLSQVYLKSSVIEQGYKTYGQGFHWYNTKRLAKIYTESYLHGRYIVKCIIPKGSKYILNSVGEGVSNQIIIKEVMK